MKHILIIARYQQPNKYTIATLVGVLENADVLKTGQISLTFVIRRDYPSQILQKTPLEEYDKVIVLLPVLSTQINYFKEEVQRLKQIRSERSTPIIIIAGGPHPTFYPEDILADGVDFVIRGEAEASLPLLVKFVAEDAKNWGDIPGLAFLQGDTVIKQPPTTIPDLDPYPPLAIQNHILSPIEITRGCPFGCFYCSVCALYGGQVRHRSIDSIHKWLKLAVRLKYNRVWFICPNSFGYGSPDGRSGKPEIVKKMLSTIAKIPGLEQIYFGTFPSEVRPEFVTKEMLDAVVPYVANKSFTIGTQTASNAMLERIHRQHSFEDVQNAIDLMRGAGFRVDLDFIFGLPGETDADKEKNLDFFHYVQKTSGIRIHAHTFMPLPGTKFQNEKPGELAGEYKEILGRLALKKKAFGSFLVQENRARDIWNARTAREQ